MRYLGIDYGTKRVGIAMSDENGDMAFPKEVLKNDAQLIEKIRALITTNDIKKVVIGESKDFKMKDNDIMGDIIDLHDVIEKALGVDTELHPEFMSSQQAEFFQGKTATTDASAATIILQSYLDTLKHKK